MGEMIPLYGFGGKSGRSFATLTITAPVGATVTVSKDGKTKTQAAVTGTAIFKGLSTGIWTVTASKDSDSASKTVEIKADYETQIGFFTATIHVVYPAGLVCTATNGSTTLNAPDTSGTWDCVVTEAGQWTVKLSTGFAEKVTVGASGESHTVNKWYVYKDGDQRTELTGGWESVKYGNPIFTFDDTKVIINTQSANNKPGGKVFPVNACNLTGFSVLKAAVTMYKSYNAAVGIIEAGISTQKITSANASGEAKATTKTTGTISANLSGVTSGLAEAYPYFMVNSAIGYLHQLWLEV